MTQVTKQDTLGKLADIMCNWCAVDFALLPATQFCADMLEIFPGKEPVLTDDEAESLMGMTDHEIHQAVLGLLRK